MLIFGRHFSHLFGSILTSVLEAFLVSIFLRYSSQSFLEYSKPIFFGITLVNVFSSILRPMFDILILASYFMQKRSAVIKRTLGKH